MCVLERFSSHDVRNAVMIHLVRGVQIAPSSSPSQLPGVARSSDFLAGKGILLLVLAQSFLCTACCPRDVSRGGGSPPPTAHYGAG